MKKQLLLVLLIAMFLTPLNPTTAAAQHTIPVQTTTFLPIFDDSYIDPESVLADGGLVLEIGEGAAFEQIVVESPSAFAINPNNRNRTHTYTDDRIRISLSFNPEIVDNYSLASLVENFSAMNVEIFFPERDTENSTVFFKHFAPLEVLEEEAKLSRTDGMFMEFTAYEDQHLSGMIRGVMTAITTRTEDRNNPECVLDDIVGICYEDESTYLPFTVHFNIPVQEN